jgi:4-hydroxybutyrate CoA-transferase
MKKKSVSDAIGLIPTRANVFVHGGAATPNFLLKEIVNQQDRFKELKFFHLHTEGPALYANEKYQEKFKIVNFFVGENLRKKIDYKRIDYIPCFLSEIPSLFRSKSIPLDVALLHVSPPDRFGYCSLGVSVDIAKAAAESAKILIAQVNPQMPRVHGDALISIDSFDALVEEESLLPEFPTRAASAQEILIAKHISELVQDGSTLQMGIGSIPDAVARELIGHKNLGLHTEMWSDGVLQLLKTGSINNSLKKVHRGKSVSGFLMGTKAVYDFVNDNPSVLQLEVDYVNNPNVISRNPKVVAINSAVEIDLTGQVCADSIGHKIISGVGGQMDFMRGAALSKGGMPIIAMGSITSGGESKIVSSLKSGAGVVTTRSHVHYVVTEFGVAYLVGKTLGERAKALIAISHPSHREKLEKDFRENHLD